MRVTASIISARSEHTSPITHTVLIRSSSGYSTHSTHGRTRGDPHAAEDWPFQVRNLQVEQVETIEILDSILVISSHLL